MKMKEMYSAMEIAEMIINQVNQSIGITKFVSWNEMHQKLPGELIKKCKEHMGDEQAMSTADWCLDIHTINALSHLLKYAQDNNEGVIISYEYSLAIICKSKEVEKEILKKLPKAIVETSQYNIKDIEILDNSCIIKYNDKIKVLNFNTRPAYIYNLITNTYE